MNKEDSGTLKRLLIDTETIPVIYLMTALHKKGDNAQTVFFF